MAPVPCRALARGVVAVLVATAAGRAETATKGPGWGDLAQVEQLQNTLAQVAEAVSPSVVAISSRHRIGAFELRDQGIEMPDDQAHRGLGDQWVPAVGSGIIISADGLILTNEHVIHNADPENITCTLAGGEAYTVRAITSDPRSDLAVLRIDARGLKPAKLGDLGSVKQGHFAIVMGNPFGSASEARGRPAMSFGIISALGRPLTRQLDPLGNRYYGNLIQTDARIIPGNSGGPLLNIKGEVIGINTAISTRSGASEGVGYAIPIDQRVKRLIAQLTRGEEIEYGFIGVKLEDPTAEDRRLAGGPVSGGAVVREVLPGTPAAVANLQVGDLIVSFAGQLIMDADHLFCLVGDAPVGTAVAMVFHRDHKCLNVTIAPARRQTNKGVNLEAPMEWRGMHLGNPSPELCREFRLPETVEGIVVTEVETGGSAHRAGIEPGCVIARVGDITIKTVRRLREIAPSLSGPVKISLAQDPPVEITLP